MSHVTDPSQIREDIRHTATKIIAYAKGVDWSDKGGATIPSYMCASDEASDFDEFSERSKNEKLYQLWYLFDGAGTARMNILFRKMVKSPCLSDQLDAIVDLFPVYTVQQADAAGKFINETSVYWIEWQRQNGAMQHTARKGPGPRLQTTNKRTERRESIIPMGATFVMDMNFLDTERGHDEYLMEFDSLVESIRFAWVRQILSTAVNVGIENLHTALRSRIPLARNDLHSLLQEYAETKLMLAKDNNLGMEGLESVLVMNLLSQCAKRPDFLLVDPSVSNSVFSLRADSFTIEGAPDSTRRDQSLVPVDRMLRGNIQSLRERITILCAPPIPDLTSGLIYHALQSDMVFGDWVAWLADSDAAILENGEYKTSDRAITVVNGDSGCSESIELEVPMSFAGLFLHGKLTWMGAGVIRSINEYKQHRQIQVSTGVYNSESSVNGGREWWQRGPDEIKVDGDDDNGLWAKIGAAFHRMNMHELDNTIEYSNIPKSLNLYTLVKNAGYLERYRKTLGSMSAGDLSGLEEAARQAALGGARDDGKRKKSAVVTYKVPSNVAPAVDSDIVLYLPTAGDTDNPHPIHGLYWPAEDVSKRCSVQNDQAYHNALLAECKQVNKGTKHVTDLMVTLKARVGTLVMSNPGVVQNYHEKKMPGIIKAVFADRKLLTLANLLFFGDKSRQINKTYRYCRSVMDLVAFGLGVTKLMTDENSDPLKAYLKQAQVEELDSKNFYATKVPFEQKTPELYALIGPTTFVRELTDVQASTLNLFCAHLRDLRFHIPLVEFAAVQAFVARVADATADNDEGLANLVQVVIDKKVVNHDEPWKDLKTAIENKAFNWTTAVQRMVEAGGRIQPMGLGGGGSVDCKDTSVRSADFIDELLRNTKVSENVFQWLLHKNIVFPMGFIGARTDIRFRTASALAGLRKTALFTIMKECELTSSLRQEHSDIVFSAMVKYAVVSENRNQITFTPDVKPLAYVHGAGTQFFIPNATARQAFNQGTLTAKTAQYIVMAVPAKWKPTSAVLDLFGQAHPEMQIADDNAPLDYPTALCYTAFWKQFGVRPNVYLLSETNLKHPQRTPTLFRQSHHRTRARGQVVHVEGASPLGYNVTTQSFRVADGRNIYGGNLEGSRRYPVSS
jgi:aryl carrier-like protein